MGQVPIHYNNQFYFAYTFFIIWPLLFSFTFLSKIRLHLFFNIGDVEFNSVQKCQSCYTWRSRTGSCEFQTDCQSVKKLVPCKVNTFYIDICCKTALSRVMNPGYDYPLFCCFFRSPLQTHQQPRSRQYT